MPTRLTSKLGALPVAIGLLLVSPVRRIIGRRFGLRRRKFTPALTPKWRRSESIFLGHEPTFEIWCRICGEEMFLRYTAVVLERIIMRAGHKACNELAYKCPECGLVDRFIVPDSIDYIREMLKARNGVELYYPPVGTWRKISDKIRLQLESLGYVGGMEIEKPETQVLRPGS